MPRQSHTVNSPTMLARLEVCDKQLLSLDIALQPLISQGKTLGPEDTRRTDFLAHMRDRVRGLRLVIAHDAHKQATNLTDLGMPDFDDCSVAELAVLRHFLDSRLKLLRSLYNNLMNYLGVVARAAEGRVGNIRAAFCLAKLKLVLENMARASHRLTQDEKALTKVNDKLVAGISVHGKGHHLAGNVSGLIQLFEEIDATSGRIAKIKAKVAQEEFNIVQMKEWLANNGVLKGPLSQDAPIPPLALSIELEEGLKPPALKNLDRNASRLTMAKHYVHDFLSQARQDGAPTAAEVEPLQKIPESHPPRDLHAD